MPAALHLRKSLPPRKHVIGSILFTGIACAAWSACQPSREELTAEGGTLFLHEWTVNDPLSGGGDGLGPVFNASSCVACHFQGGAGGAGPRDRNVRAFEVFPTRNDPRMYAGVVHAAATSESLRETDAQVHADHPIVPGGVTVIGGCNVRVEDFDPVQFASINTPALFGAGLIDELSAWTIRSQQFNRQVSGIAKELRGNFETTPSGRVRILPDGRVGKFGWKAQFATLEEFVATACAVEVGLSNHYRKQDLPGAHRPDENAAADMTRRQLDALTTFCSDLAAPVRVWPEAPAARLRAERGEQTFLSIGCADCHTPDLGSVSGIYSDLCLHVISEPDDPGYIHRLEAPLPNDVPTPEEWKTPPLWGVADSAPYMHDGSAATLKDAIFAHQGAAKEVTGRYKALGHEEQAAVLAFLRTLRAPQAKEAAVSTTEVAASR